jgi:heptosyltransferase II
VAPRRRTGSFLRIGLVPGAEYGPTKRWFPERFAEAAKKIAVARACRFVLFGVAKDAEVGGAIETELGLEHCENRIGKTSLAELMQELQQCDLLLTNDTGTMHLAAWLDVPLVAIFGSTDPIATGPLSARARVVRHQVECSPCFLRECPLDLRCLRAVSADEVAAAALEMLPVA